MATVSFHSLKGLGSFVNGKWILWIPHSAYCPSSFTVQEAPSALQHTHWVVEMVQGTSGEGESQDLRAPHSTKHGTIDLRDCILFSQYSQQALTTISCLRRVWLRKNTVFLFSILQHGIIVVCQLLQVSFTPFCWFLLFAFSVSCSCALALHSSVFLIC